MKSILIIIFLGQLIYSQSQKCPTITTIYGMSNFEIARLTGNDEEKPQRWYVLKKLGSHNFPNFSDNLNGLTFYFKKKYPNSQFEVVLRGKNEKSKCARIEGTGYLVNPNTNEGKIAINYTSPEISSTNGNSNSWTKETVFWILGSDKSNDLVFYACNRFTDMTCSEHVVFILSHQKYNIDDNIKGKEAIMDILTPLCVKYGDLYSVELDASSDCTPETERCDMDYLPIEKQMDFNDLNGKWYAAKQSGNIEQFYPKESKYAVLEFKSDQGRVHITFYGRSKENTCLEPKEGTADVRYVKDGYYFININSRRIDFVILKYDDQQQQKRLTILYFCEHKYTNGSCDADKSMKFFLVRPEDSRFTSDYYFTHYLKENCLDPKNDLFDNEFNRIARDCTNKANVENCDIETFEVMDSLDLKKLSGQWYQLRERITYGRPSSQHHVTVEYKEDQYLNIINRGRDKDNKCSKHTMTATFRNANKKDGHLILLPRNSSYWIISTDYDNYTIIYSCAEIFQNGSCLPAKTSAWIISRQTILSNKTYNLIQTELEKICLSHDHFEDTKWTMDPCKDKAFDLQVSWWLLLGTIMAAVSI